MKAVSFKIIFSLFLFLLGFFGFALNVPPLTGPVVDLANVLTSVERQDLEQTLIESQKLGAQVQILIVSDLEGTVIEEYSMRVAETWKIGTKKKDNGVIILLAIKDRAMRLEIGGGLEGVISDLIAKKIINEMKPYLRQQHYMSALKLGVSQIYAYVQRDTEHATVPSKGQAQSVDFSFLIIAGIVFIFLSFLSRWKRLLIGEVLLAIFGTSVFSGIGLIFLLFGGAFLLLTVGEILHLWARLRGRGGSRWGGGGSSDSGGGWSGGGSSGSGGGWSGGGGGYSGGGASGKW